MAFLLLLVLLFCASIAAFRIRAPTYTTRTTALQSTQEEVDEEANIEYLSQIANRLKLVKFAQTGDSFYGLEVASNKFYTKTEKFDVSTEGGIGLELIEAVDKRDGGGLVLVGGIRPGSNAEKTGGFKVGDALHCVSVAGVEIKTGRPNLEGLNYDRSVDVLSATASEAGAGGAVTLTVQRTFERAEISLEIVGPEGEEVVEFPVIAGFGANLRTALQSNNLKMYDERTSRFDSPYQTGNCGGEGTCGTCVVAVLEGADLLAPKLRVEEKALRIQAAPPNYRWACRLKIGPDPAAGGKVKIKLRPQTQLWDWKAKNR